ncbi:hypothetical protein ABZ379_06265 [Streptomyces canus]|uniref:hypothetical protein n=1 Tax=Streptomyces canus TaxID=58343 RepID=UPI0033EC68E7
MSLHPASIDPFVPPTGWKMHTIGAFESRRSVAAQEARRMPEDAVYLMPAIEKLPQWAHVLPAWTEYCLMSIERITGVIDFTYFEEPAGRLRVEPWGTYCEHAPLCYYPWLEFPSD